MLMTLYRPFPINLEPSAAAEPVVALIFPIAAGIGLAKNATRRGESAAPRVHETWSAPRLRPYWHVV
jgi:hypothetical protein